MTTASTTETAPAKPAKDPVLDSKDQALELGMRVVILGDKYKDEKGKPRLGTVTGLEYARKRCVIAMDDQEKLIVRPATQTYIKKTKSGKIERVERAVRAGRKPAATPAVETPAPAVVEPIVEAPVVSDADANEAPVPTA